MQQPLLTLNLQYFAEDSEAPSDWSSYLSESVTESVDDQPIEESEEEVETEDTEEEVIEDEVEPDNDEEQEETEEEKPLFDDDTEIELGEDKKPVKLSELKNGYLRQSDYTKKTQALSEERKSFETEKEALEPIRAWQEEITSNPWLYSQINEAIKTFHETGTLPIEEVLADAQYGQYVNHLLAENNKLQQELDQISGEYQSSKFDSDMKSLMNDLKAEYGDLITPEYETQLIEQAKQDGFSTDVIKRIAKGDLAEKKLQQTQKESKKVEAKTKQKMRETKLPPQPKNKGQQPAKEEINLDGDWLSVFKQVGGK